jgi:hypothetical protein
VKAVELDSCVIGIVTLEDHRHAGITHDILNRFTTLLEEDDKLPPMCCSMKFSNTSRLPPIIIVNVLVAEQ